MAEKRTIVMIGPVYPYKGGISHYTGLMIRNLAEKYNVVSISYKLQYPKFLFKKEQKDYKNEQFKIEDTKFLINTANPFNIIGVARKIKKMNPDLVIMQWWHPYFAPCYWILETFLGKKIQKMFICHNVFPHERFPMDRFLTKLVLKKGDAFIVHSKIDGKDLMAIKQDAKYKQNPHPTYNAFKMRDISKEQARSEIEENQDTKLLLFFGFVRKYKGLMNLIKAMPHVLKELPDIRLYVVGDFDNDKEEYMKAMKNLKVEQAIKVVDDYIPDAEVEKYFAASDLVVLPYESATQSGIVQIAYSFEKPVIATNVGGLPEVVLDNRTGYLVEAQNEKALAEKIIQFFKEDKEELFHQEIMKEAERYSWDRMRETIEKLWEGNKGD